MGDTGEKLPGRGAARAEDAGKVRRENIILFPGRSSPWSAFHGKL
jgi:hypothetical protein